MSKTIDRFTGKYAFLSNFWRSPNNPGGTVEHDFQSTKTTRREEKHIILGSPTPGRAKQLGREVNLRPDWERIKLAVMLRCLRRKFIDPKLRAQLQATGDALLIEGNTWGDAYWGQVDGHGANWLGRLLMVVRAEICLDDGEHSEQAPVLDIPVSFPTGRGKLFKT